MTNNIKAANSEAVLVRGQAVTRRDVMRSIRECLSVGQPNFLKKYGYDESVRYHLRFGNWSLPSKAILGVAAGLESKDFFGGAADTVRSLNKLGFQVRNSITGEIVDALGIEALCRLAIAAGFDDPAPWWDELPVAPVAYFLSGSNLPAEIAGLSKIGADIGVAAGRVSRKAEAELKMLYGSDVLVFFDSGAFGEVKFNAASKVMEIIRPITNAEWRKRLDMYKRVGRVLGSQLFAVAPDRIGSQSETLIRLATYKQDIVDLIAMGCRVMVVMQKGALSQADFAIEVDRVLGTSDWVVGLPCNKAATTPAEVSAFLAARVPKHVHLLGIGVSGRGVGAYLDAFVGSTTSVSLDSCWILANVSGGRMRRDGTLGGVGRYRKAQQMVAQVAPGGTTKYVIKQAALALCLGKPIV